MRNIKKQAEPNSLKRHRRTAHADYDNYAAKDELREHLVSEQRGICCYCMQRIRPKESEMKIEHWHARSRKKYPAEQLDYRNLLGACLGGPKKRLEEQHCDTLKGDTDLSFNPADPTCDVERMFRFPGSGRIETDDRKIQSELETVLNLNYSLLVKNRKAVLDAFRERLQRKSATDSDLRKELAKWNGNSTGTLEPFCQVVVYYLRKKLKSQ